MHFTHIPLSSQGRITLVYESFQTMLFDKNAPKHTVIKVAVFFTVPLMSFVAIS